MDERAGEKRRLRRLVLLSLAVALASIGCEDKVPLRACTVDRNGPDFEAYETRCDDLDNDCDGLTDVLVPGVHNACESTATGACRAGVASCVAGARQCLTPPPVRETWDGIDNDCDGSTDEGILSADRLPALARIVAPPYLWDPDEDPKAIALLRAIFEQAGIPVQTVAADDPVPKLDWGALFQELDTIRLLVIPGYVIPSFIDAASGDLAKLEAWVNKGGVLIWMKPLGPSAADNPQSQAHYAAVAKLGGVLQHQQVLNAERVRLTGRGEATLWLEHGPERDILISTEPDNPKKQMEVFTFTTTPDTEVLAEAYGSKGSLGATWLRRKLGLGAVYTLGWDPSQYAPQRCYVNCFDPGVDVAQMLFKGAWREASGGHYVVKHTVPGVEPAVLISSHDVDAPDAQNAGSWGDPGATRMAEMEQQEGVKGTYFITTDYVTKYYNPAIIKRLCQLGMCPEGGHSIQHLYWGKFPVGDCGVTQQSYDPTRPTLCGEIAINLRMMRATLPKGQRLDAWRTPYLETNPKQYKLLSSLGVRYDSSLATGDLRTNFPVDLPRYPHYGLEDMTGLQEMWVFPVNLEDGIGWYEDGVEMRREVQPKWLSEFRHRWAEQLEGNAANHAWNVELIHPSFGVGKGVGPENLQVKIEASRWIIRYAKSKGMRVARIDKLGDFWRGRHHARLRGVTYNSGVYTGQIKVGKVQARRFSLAFGDRIKTFEHNTNSPVTIAGNRVVFESILPANATVVFTARVDKGGK